MAGHRKNPLPFNPEMLRWAREHAGRSCDQAARHVGVKESKVVGWEAVEPEGTPTVRQARLLADYYDRSLFEFFRKSPPDLPKPQLVPDFRLHHDADEHEYARVLADVQMWAEAQRTSALDLYSEIGEEPPIFPEELFASLDDDAETIAGRSREAMAFAFDEQIGLKKNDRYKLPSIIRNKMESLNILTLRRSDLKSMKVRGFCIAEFPLPIVVFTSESPTAQCFTLAHEFAHICLRQSAISGHIPRQGGNQAARRVEEWCNSFSAAFLIPRAQVTAWRAAPNVAAQSISDDDLNDVAGRFAVSPHAMLIRLVELKYVRAAYYWDVKRPQFFEEEAAFKAVMRTKYYGSRYRSSLGELYTTLVIEAWSTGRITNHQAAEFMGIKKLVHLKDIRENFEM